MCARDILSGNAVGDREFTSTEVLKKSHEIRWTGTVVLAKDREVWVAAEVVPALTDAAETLSSGDELG
jgi:hypothetical protein